MANRGKFITIEGQDGAGKSTNLEVIREVLQSKEIDFVTTREPGGTPFGETIRELILNSTDQQFGDTAELLLMFASRAQHIEQVIEPALAAGRWVLCDRFTDATYAYQGGGREMSIATIENLENVVQKSLRPDLTLLLDLPVEIGEQRAGQRSEADRFEMQKKTFKQSVRDAYLQRAHAEPGRIKVVNAQLSLEEVSEQIKNIIGRFTNG